MRKNILNYLSAQEITFQISDKIGDNCKVAVVIPFYNEEYLLPRCLDAFLKQKNVEKDSFELVLVNNLSTDNSVKIAEEFIINNPEITAFLIDENIKGVTRASKKGLDEVLGQLVRSNRDDIILARSGADTVVADNWISEIINTFESKKCMAAGGNITLRPDTLLGLASASVFQKYYQSRAFIKKNFFPDLRGNWALTADCYAQIGGFKIIDIIDNKPDFNDDGYTIEQKIEKLGGTIEYFDVTNFTSPRRVFESIINGHPENYFKYGFTDIRDEKSMIEGIREVDRSKINDFYRISTEGNVKKLLRRVFNNEVSPKVVADFIENDNFLNSFNLINDRSLTVKDSAEAMFLDFGREILEKIEKSI